MTNELESAIQCLVNILCYKPFFLTKIFPKTTPPKKNFIAEA